MRHPARIRPVSLDALPFFLTLWLFMLLSGAVLAEANGQDMAFRQAVAEAAVGDAAVAEFYQDRGFEPLWTGAGDARRREALLSVLARAPDHGLPVVRYDAAALTAAFRNTTTERDRGRLDVAMTQALLSYARDVRSGVLDPAKVDAGILREPARPDRRAQLDAFAAADPAAFLRALPPSGAAYAALMHGKLTLEAQIFRGGWGLPVTAGSLAPRDSGPQVVALRDRLIAMGYLRPTPAASYDAQLETAVRAFQIAHGLPADGVASDTTLAEINVAPDARLQAIVVAMERLRWMQEDLGARHVWVNVTDFTATIVDHGRVTFSTRAVVGKNEEDQRTPEFSDQIDYMVINPSWSVPRSITTKEYLPLLKRNRNAAGHLKIVDRNGRVVSRAAINFAAYSERNFPYSMLQLPSDGNALGKVKFIFPNPHNIYLHDTPQKALFQNDVRAYSHGCIRLNEPIAFAHELLSPQSDDPEGLFGSYLKTGAEAGLRLDQPVPVHLVYFTAWPSARGQVTYRRDVYGRDAALFRALTEAGVVLAPDRR